MEIVTKLKAFEGGLPASLQGWIERKKESLETGACLISSNFASFDEAEEPFFLLFDEFHVKNLKVS